MPEVDAATRVWLCEKGHIDDHHYTVGDMPGAQERCSRCGGFTAEISLDGLARRAQGAGAPQKRRSTGKVQVHGKSAGRQAPDSEAPNRPDSSPQSQKQHVDERASYDHLKAGLEEVAARKTDDFDTAHCTFEEMRETGFEHYTPAAIAEALLRPAEEEEK